MFEETIVVSSSESTSYRKDCFQFRLLPPELRNAVYRFYLVFLFSLQLNNDEEIVTSTDLTLFQVDRQMWIEASSIFYSENIFSFYLTGLLESGENELHPHFKRMKKCHIWNLCSESSQVLIAISHAIKAWAAHESKLEDLLVTLPDVDAMKNLPLLAHLSDFKQAHFVQFDPHEPQKQTVMIDRLDSLGKASQATLKIMEEKLKRPWLEQYYGVRFRA